MKKPEYSIKSEVKVDLGPGADPIIFPIGTLVMPFWSPHNLASHIREKFEEDTKYFNDRSEYVMCQIGMTWIAVKREDIRQQ